MTMRPASPDDLETIATLTTAAYRPYTELFGAPPIPVTEDYAPRIERGEVWLREIGGQTAGLVVVEQHCDHLMLFSIAVSPAFQGAGNGPRRRSGSTRMRGWSGTSRSTAPSGFRKRVAGRTLIGQDGHSST